MFSHIQVLKLQGRPSGQLESMFVLETLLQQEVALKKVL